MTDKEKIASIAKAYAEHLDSDDKANRTMIEVDCIGFAEWLKEEFEIVAKDKVREAISNIRDAYNNGDNDMVDAYLEELESLFPQILKSEEK